MATATPEGGNKRKREALHALTILDLPDVVILSVARYLPQTSRALLALALTAEASSWRNVIWYKANSICTWVRTTRKEPSAATKALVSAEGWHDLDFVDIEKDLAKRLTDEDVAGVLACVGAVSKLKSLKLTGLVNITGRGLQPLKSSTKLELLDLSLKKRYEIPSDLGPDREDSAKKEKKLLLSKFDVIPILESIVDAYGCRLKYLHLPAEWRDKHRGVLVDKFLEKYHSSDCQRVQCRKCRLSLAEEFDLDPTEDNYALQHFACYNCLANYCYACDDEQGDACLSSCTGCSKDYCIRCNPSSSVYCENCDDCWFCAECAKKKECKRCKEIFCGSGECVSSWETCRICSQKECCYCIIAYHCEACRLYFDCCSDCDDKHYWARCEECTTDNCFDCRLTACQRNWKSTCKGCMSLIGPPLANYYDRMLDAKRIFEHRHQFDHTEDHSLEECEECGTCGCFDCRLKGCRKDWQMACDACMRIVGPRLANYYDNMQRVERILKEC